MVEVQQGAGQSLVDRLGLDSEGQLKACMVPLLDALGWRGTPLQLHEALPKTSTEFNLGNLLNTMANIHYESQVSEIPLAALEDSLLPCLVCDDEGNAAVLVKRTEKGHLLYDGKAGSYLDQPIRGDEKQTVIRFVPMKKQESVNPLQRQPFWFLNLSLRFRQLYILGGLVTVLLSMLALITPLFIMAIYSQLQVAGASPPLLMIGAGVMIYMGSDLIFRVIRGQIFLHLSDRITYLLSTQVLRRLLYMPPSLTENATTQSQLSRIKEFEGISSFFSGPAIHGILDLLTTFVLLGAMAWIGGAMVWIPLIVLVMAMVFGIFIRSTLSKATAMSSRSESRKQELLFDMVQHYRSMRTGGFTSPLLKQYEELSSEATLNQLDTTKVHTMVSTFSQGVNQIAGIATMVLGVHLVMSGALPGSALLACMLLTWKILSPVRNLFTVISQIEKTLKSIQQLNRFMNLPQEIQPEVMTTLPQRLHGDIVFSGVSMKPSADQQASLMNISFQLKRNEIMVICGHGGVDGQSVLDALMLLRDYQSGNISINDVNIRQFDPVTLRKSLDLVPAKTQLFRVSLRDNLLLSMPTATEGEIERVVHEAHLDPDIERLANGLDTMVDGRPDQFSESFVKRFSFARTWLRRAEIQLYQLPDKGLTKSRVLELGEKLMELRASHTILVVTNNPDLFNLADTVVWLEQGRVKNMGMPEKVGPDFYGGS